VRTQYLPDELKNRQYYIPSLEGEESRLAKRLATLWRGIKQYTLSRKTKDTGDENKEST